MSPPQAESAVLYTDSLLLPLHSRGELCVVGTEPLDAPFSLRPPCISLPSVQADWEVPNSIYLKLQESVKLLKYN